MGNGNAAIHLTDKQNNFRIMRVRVRKKVYGKLEDRAETIKESGRRCSVADLVRDALRIYFHYLNTQEIADPLSAVEISEEIKKLVNSRPDMYDEDLKEKIFALTQPQIQREVHTN